MSGPNPPGRDSGLPGEEPDRAADVPAPEAGGSGRNASDNPDTGQTDFHSRAYSAPESEQFVSSPYVPSEVAALRLRQLRRLR